MASPQACRRDAGGIGGCARSETRISGTRNRPDTAGALPCFRLALPMYGAGKLERRNIVAYEHAARYAIGCGKLEFVDCLLVMAEVEWEHEQYFRAKVLSHPVGRRLPIWPAPPPKETIRGVSIIPSS